MIKISTKSSLPLVGVVLPVYNQEEHYIYECFASIEAQKYRNFSLVIVIDGADRNTENAVKTGVKQLTVPYEIICRKENRGIAYSLSEGFSHLHHCHYLTWISSDNRYLPNFLAKLVQEFHESSEGTVLIYSLFYHINKTGERINGSTESEWFRMFMERAKSHIFQHCFIGPSFMFTKDAYVAAGCYSTTYETAEDHEFWMRLLQQGEIRFIYNYLMEYRYGGKHAYTTVLSQEDILLQSARASVENRRRYMGTPKITVLMAVRNHARYVGEAIESILNQSFTDFLLIVVDDESTDSTWDELSRYFDERIIPLRLATNRGKPTALNLAMEFVMGDYVLEIDGDDWLEPDTLDVMVAEMEKQPASVGMAYANRKLWFEHGDMLKEGPVFPGYRYKNKYEVLKKMRNHCPRLYRKSALDAVGGWPTTIVGQKLLSDDFYLMLLLAEKYTFHYIDRVFYHQRRHNGNMTETEQQLCIEQIRLIVREVLKRWGNEYEPVFHREGPWISEVTLVKKEQNQGYTATKNHFVSREKDSSAVYYRYRRVY